MQRSLSGSGSYFHTKPFFFFFKELDLVGMICGNNHLLIHTPHLLVMEVQLQMKPPNDPKMCDNPYSST